MQLEGHLKQFPLTELISMIVASSVTGVLDIGERAAIGQLFCRDGRFYHAHSSSCDGFEAVCRLLEVADARFRFTAGTTCDTLTIRQHPQLFLSEIETYANRWAEVSQQIPTADWVPVICGSLDHLSERLSRATHDVAVAVDGQRSVGAIATLTRQSLLATSVILIELMASGLIRVEPPHVTVAPARAGNALSLLDRVRARASAEAPARQPAAGSASLLQRWGFNRR